MSDSLNSEFYFYLNELHRSMNEAIEEFAAVLMNNLHNEKFDAKKAQQYILMKYFPESQETTH